MTALLEQLFDNSASDRNFRKLQELFGFVTADSDGFGFTVGSVGIRFGTAAATWTASVSSASVTVPHGLGKTPVFAEASTRNGLIHYAVTGRDATNLTVVGYVTYNSAFTGGPITFDWLAVG